MTQSVKLKNLCTRFYNRSKGNEQFAVDCLMKLADDAFAKHPQRLNSVIYDEFCKDIVAAQDDAAELVALVTTIKILSAVFPKDEPAIMIAMGLAAHYGGVWDINAAACMIKGLSFAVGLDVVLQQGATGTIDEQQSNAGMDRAIEIIDKHIDEWFDHVDAEQVV